MIAKLGIVIEEADETQFWLEVLVDAELLKPDQIAELHGETDEILRMTVASVNTLKGNRSKED